MNIEKLLDDMESMLLDAPRVPLTNKRVLEEDDIGAFIDEIRELLPKEIFEARRILSEKQRILDEAQREAHNMVEQAKRYVTKLTDEHVIAKQAEEQANHMLSEARRTSQDLRRDSLNYAGDVFNHLSMNLERALEAVRNAQRDLQKSQQQSQQKNPQE